MSVVLIFGGTGSLGKTLIKRFMCQDYVTQVIAFSRDEAKHWTIRNELQGQYGADKVRFLVGDIRDKERVKEAITITKAQTIIVAAALKQVDTCELSPRESILTNLIGTQNVVEAVAELHNTTVLFVSTDKACSPVNVYGMCKAVSERVVTSQAERHGTWGPRFIGVRYGNVLESRGSIIPLFKYQAENAEFLTVTDPNMTRFVMTLDDSVDLIQKALKEAKSGEIWIPRLPSMRIGDLAEIFAVEHGKKIKIIGLRPGEKMHEALINDSESVRTRKEGDRHYVIGPAFKAGFGDAWSYTSEDDVMTKKQLGDHLVSLGIFGKPLSEFEGRSIEEIVK